jgi:hypothetical protein
MDRRNEYRAVKRHVYLYPRDAFVLRQKPGGGVPKVTFGPEAEREALVEAQGARLLDIDRALTRLQGLHDRVGQVVEPRCFAG